MASREEIQFKTHYAIIDSISQRNFHSGRLEGLPTREGNERIISKVLSNLRTERGEPYLVPPVETPIPYPRGNYPFGEPAVLPKIMCIASLHSSFSSKYGPDGASHLTVVWFQEDFAFPIDSLILEHLQALEWERHAIEYEL